jgi:hypothetical protein
MFGRDIVHVSEVELLRSSPDSWVRSLVRLYMVAAGRRRRLCCNFIRGSAAFFLPHFTCNTSTFFIIPCNFRWFERAVHPHRHSWCVPPRAEEAGCVAPRYFSIIVLSRYLPGSAATLVQLLTDIISGTWHSVRLEREAVRNLVAFRSLFPCPPRSTHLNNGQSS